MTAGHILTGSLIMTIFLILSAIKDIKEGKYDASTLIYGVIACILWGVFYDKIH